MHQNKQHISHKDNHEQTYRGYLTHQPVDPHRHVTEFTLHSSQHIPYLLFANCAYKLHVINTTMIYPYTTITFQHQISLYRILTHQSRKYLIVIDQYGKWHLLALTHNDKDEMLQVQQCCSGVMQDQDRNRTVGIHVLAQKSNPNNDTNNTTKIIFVKQNGIIYYTTIKLTTNGHMKATNMAKVSQYKIQQIGNLGNHRYLGRTLLKQYLSSSELQHHQQQLCEKDKNKKKIIHTYMGEQPQSIIYCVIQDPQTSLYSILMLELCDYEIKMGVDSVLNLLHRPLSMHIYGSLAVLHMGMYVLLWTPNQGKTHRYQLVKTGEANHHQQWCYSIDEVHTNKTKEKAIFTYRLISINNSQTIISTNNLQINLTTSSVSLSHKTKNQHPNLQILKIWEQGHNKNIVLTDRLQLMKIQPSQQQMIVNNLKVEIVYSQLIHKAIIMQNVVKIQQYDTVNGLLLCKKLGYHKEWILLTNNRIIGDINVYQHNMLFKMANIVYVPLHASKGNTMFYISSPIIGTQALTLSKDKLSPTIILTNNKPEPYINNAQQSLYVDDYCQITSTAINVNNGKKINIGDLFEGNNDLMISCGCRVGTYIVIAVDTQVHIFKHSDADGGLERVCIYCIQQKYDNNESQQFSSDDEFPEEQPHQQLKLLTKINNVNMFLMQMWSGFTIICRIQQIHDPHNTKNNHMEVKVIQNLPINKQYINKTLHKQIIINTKQYMCTILSNGCLIVANNDPLQLYQNASKSQVRVIDNMLPVPQMRCLSIYDILIGQGSDNAEKSMVLVNAEDGRQTNSWYILTLQYKNFIKQGGKSATSIPLIPLQIQQIVGFPSQHLNSQQTSSTNNQLLLCVLIPQYSWMILMSTNKIVSASLMTGKINLCDNDGINRWVMQNSESGIKKTIMGKEQGVKKIKMVKNSGQKRQEIDIQIINIIKMPQYRGDKTPNVLVYNEKQIWSARYTHNKSPIQLISYFSISNNSFLEFKNNLTVRELENQEFMNMFAYKLPIKSVHILPQGHQKCHFNIVVIYDKYIVVLEIGKNQEFSIVEQIKLQAQGVLAGIQKVLGYGKGVLYMKDGSHRLLKLTKGQSHMHNSKYEIVIGQQLQDEIVSMHLINNGNTKDGQGQIRKGKKWSQRSFKYLPSTQTNSIKQQELGEVIIVRKDGQFIVTDHQNDYYHTFNAKPVYL